LYYEIRGSVTRLPFVHVVINGERTILLVDSGATDHALASWFAEQLNIEVYPSPADITVDHDGNQIAAKRARGVQLSLEGWGDVEGSDPFVLELPSIFAEHGIGGILAPQLIRLPGQRLALDLAGGSLSVESEQCAEHRRTIPRSCLLSAQPVESCASGAHGVGPLFAVPAVVAGVAARLVVDTGSRETDVFASSAAGSRLANDPAKAVTLGYVASGSSPGTLVPSVKIELGTCAFSEPIVLDSGAPGKLCKQDGVIGIDVLGSCVLVIGDRGLSGTCANGSAGG
jgi:hypothetical protein